MQQERDFDNERNRVRLHSVEIRVMDSGNICVELCTGAYSHHSNCGDNEFSRCSGRHCTEKNHCATAEALLTEEEIRRSTAFIHVWEGAFESRGIFQEDSRS